jgi:hypothetical protein
MATLLSLVRDAWGRLGIEEDTPTAVIASTNNSVKVLRALAAQEGKELARRATWERLTREQTITTTATQVQSGAIPADFDRMIPDTCWNYTENEPMLGPLAPAEWQTLSAGLVGPPDLYFRIRGGDFLILPTPEAGQSVRFEYLSRYWVDTNADGDGDAEDFAADTDEPVLDAELITLGLVWRWLKRQRLPYQDEFNEYDVAVRQVIARDGVRKTINFMGRDVDDGARQPRVPDGSWNL